jgi:hypothetical protein
MWNNQPERLMAGEINDFALMDEKGDTPAILVEFVGPSPIEQLGNGNQLYNPFIVRFHILHQFYDAQSGEQDQDLKVLDIAEAIYNAFQEWMPEDVAVGVMTQTSVNWDYDHPNVYHYIQEYTTTFVDSLKNRPQNGSLSDPNATLQVVRINSLETSTQYYYN